MTYLENADAALGAMVRPLRLPALATFLTRVQLGSVDIVGHFYVFRYVTRISKTSPQMTCECKHDKPIENKEIDTAVERERHSLYFLLVQFICILPIENAKLVAGPAAEVDE